MKVLKAIGGFFVRIWHWIKDTAWVQPLLIVGLIFAVIFSIPPIVKGVEEARANVSSGDSFYANFQLSLKDGENSDADLATEAIRNKSEDPSLPLTYGGKTLSDKFFLVFVSKDCPGCKEAKDGFETLKDNFGSKFKPADGKGFAMYTVFSDETTEETTKNKSAFVSYMDRHLYFFEMAAEVGYDSDYYLNGHISDKDLETLGSADPNDFLTPTILLVDFTENAPRYGVSQVMFGVSGSDSFRKAELLLHCWDGTDEFVVK